MKRLLDIVGALAGLLLLSPLLVFVALLVRRNLGSPVLFRQTRPGLHGRPFEMLKFRSMRDSLGPDAQPLPDDQRLTRFGRWLRASSLDELPELWNVLKGDMSLVGPRPLLMEYLELYTPEQTRRHEVRPGITGWAQVNGRNAISWDDKFRLDVWYVDNQSFLLDMKILLWTCKKVLVRDGISQSGEATIQKFTGTLRKWRSGEAMHGQSGSIGHTVAIVGASGHGKVVAETALASNWADVEFYDRAWPGKQQVGRWTIAGDDAALWAELVRKDGVIVAIGDNRTRLGLLTRLGQSGASLVSIVHPTACISTSARLGQGTVVMAGSIVNADVVVGMGGILNTGCSVDHDCILGDAVHISPGAHLAGDVHVGDCSWIGIGASVRQGVRIGAGVTVGAGAAVVSDVADGLTVVGVPARPISQGGG